MELREINGINRNKQRRHAVGEKRKERKAEVLTRETLVNSSAKKCSKKKKWKKNREERKKIKNK